MGYLPTLFSSSLSPAWLCLYLLPVASYLAGLVSPSSDGDAASPTRGTSTLCDGQQHQSVAAPPEVKQEEPMNESNAPFAAFPGDQSPTSPGDPPPPCGDGSPAERQQDLGVLCQTSTPT